MSDSMGENPWYKRPLPLIACGLVALIIIGAIAGGGKRSSRDGARNGEEQTVDPRVPVTVSGTEYEVLSARTASKLGNAFSSHRANGVFVVVSLRLTNKKNDARVINSDAIKLITASGKSYDPSSDTVLDVPDPIVLEQVEPDVPKIGTLVYEIPVGQTSGATLRASDLFSDAHALIRLGL